ncbi:MAG: class A beta-lactamase-related serine hydrolase [Chloroflexi bacterium]|nr:MAG: class A beta-lactamase-related serine hydrolase [Chloroflexota bacterium]
MTFAKRLDQIIANRSREEQFSGVVLVKRDEHVLFKAAYDYANMPWKIRNQADTRFRIASISKLFTAVAVLQLIEQDKLSLDASVLECLGLENTKIPGEATVQHMLTMTSGIADWFEESGDWQETWAALCREHPIYLFRRNEDYLPLFVDKSPLFPVGEKHQYNGAGYILLGLLIEKISGLPYFDYVRQHIFEKAQMTRSDFLALDGVDEEVAEGYIPIHDKDGKVTDWKRNIYSTTVEAAADGGATSTVEDLCHFSRALREGQLLSAKWTQAMLTPKVLERPEQFKGYTWKYGYANFFLLDKADRIVRWGHTGEEDGVSCRLYYYPRENLDVVMLGNQSWCAGKVAWEIHDLILEMTP